MDYSGSDADKYRSFLSGEGEKNTQWKFGSPPNYDTVNKLFEEGRTKIWPAGSLEEKVQNFVKTWEMEMFHKLSPDDFKTADVRKLTITVNGRPPLTVQGVAKIGGGYNMFLQTSLPEELRLYDPTKETSESALKTFTTTFPRGFAVEILQVYSGPPMIAYKFRHWGYMEGPFKGHPPTGQLVEFYGVSILESMGYVYFVNNKGHINSAQIVRMPKWLKTPNGNVEQLNEEMKIVKVEFFFDGGELLAGLTKGVSPGESATTGISSSCPFK